MKNNNHALLSTLKKLYSHLAMVLVQMRSYSYRKSSHAFDITSILNSKVDDLVVHATRENTSLDKKTEKVQQSNLTHSKIQTEYSQKEKSEKVLDAESEFAKHLQQRKSISVTQPHMGDKLKKSAWEHIHSAIRYAKQGKADTAKMHTDIAGHAIEEAGHYLNDEEYSELVYQIEDYFTKSQ